MADPTAAPENNTPTPQESNSSTRDSPIEPGQFVVAGDPSIFKQPPPPGPTSPPTGSLPSTPTSAPQESPPTPPQPPSSQPLPPEQVPAAPNPPAADQPNPAPYVPPTAAAPTQLEPPSAIARLRKLAIVLVALVIISTIAGAAWFLFLNKTSPKTQVEEPETVLEPSPLPLPKRTTGGFADLPAATDQSQASPSAEVEQEPQD